ncbi:MAG: VWA domain-containing protein [Thermoanaerobaculia bacterium]
MSESWAFAHPMVLWALTSLFGYAMLRSWQRRGERVPFAPLQYRRPRGAGHLVDRLLSLAQLPVELTLIAVVIVGLAGPHRTTDLELIENEGIDVVLVLDVSLSMLAEDFPPNRLDALRTIARDFIARSGSHRVGLIIFARDAYVQTPLTTDHPVLLGLLGGVTVDTLDQALSGGTAIGDALLVAGQHLEGNKVEGRDQAVILITDGESNMGSEPELGARFLRHLGARFYAIGVGGEEPIEVFVDGQRLGGDEPYLAYLDDTQLREIAEVTDGLYYRATDVGALEDIFGELSRLESAPLELRVVQVRDFYTRYLALSSLPLFLAYLWLGGVRLRRPFR